MDKQMQISSLGNKTGYTEVANEDCSFYGQFQKSVMDVERQCNLKKIKAEEKKKQLALLKENLNRQKHNTLELQMTLESSTVKLQTEDLNSHSHLSKIAKCHKMIEDHQKYSELMRNKLHRLQAARESVKQFENELKTTLCDQQEKLEKREMEFNNYLATLKYKSQEAENNKIKQKEEYEKGLFEDMKQLGMSQEVVSDMETQNNSITTEKLILSSVFNQKSILLEETRSEKTVLASNYGNEEAETNAKEEELCCLYRNLTAELNEKKDLIKQEEEEINTLTGTTYRQEDEAKGLEVCFKEQVLLKEESYQDLVQAKIRVAENEENIGILENRIQELGDVDEENLILSTELNSVDERIECLEKENNGLLQNAEDCQDEFHKLAETKERLKIEEYNAKQLNFELQNNIKKFSLENENLTRSNKTLQEEGERGLVELKQEEKSLICENKTLQDEIAMYINQFEAERTIIEALEENIAHVNAECDCKNIEILQCEKKMKLQGNHHEMNLLIYDTMTTNLEKDMEEVHKQLEEKYSLEDEIHLLETNMKDITKENAENLQTLKEYHQSQMNALREQFIQLKVQTSSKLQISANNIKQKQSQLDGIIKNIEEVKRNTSDEMHYLQNITTRLKSYETLIRNLQNKLLLVSQVARVSQTSIKSQVSIPTSTTQPKRYYESDSDSGTSFVCPDELMPFKPKSLAFNEQIQSNQKETLKPFQRKLTF